MLAIDNVTIAHQHRHRFGRSSGVDVVHDASLTVAPGEIVALVGESGCGKSTLARTVAALHRPRLGTITFDGTDIHSLHGRQLRSHRRHVQMIFQDPVSSLDRNVPVGKSIAEAMTMHAIEPTHGRAARVRELLDLVGLPADVAGRRPNQLSGGQCQRVSIARALAVEPKLLICDESVTALDVSVQARVLNLLLDLRDELGLGCLFIAHDLAVVAHLADTVAVMHAGRIIETGPTLDLFAEPRHDRTRALIAAIPRLDQTPRSPQHETDKEPAP